MVTEESSLPESFTELMRLDSLAGLSFITGDGGELNGSMSALAFRLREMPKSDPDYFRFEALNESCGRYLLYLAGRNDAFNQGVNDGN